MIYDYLYLYGYNFMDIVPATHSRGLQPITSNMTTDWTKYKRAFQGLSQTCRLLRKEGLVKLDKTLYDGWMMWELSELDEYAENWGTSETTEDMFEIWVKGSWSLRGAEFDLRRFLIVYNKAPGMALRLSTHHCCSYPSLSTDDGITGTQACMDSGLSYEERIWYEGQASENHLEDAQGSAKWIELLESSVAVKPGLAVCSYDETSWIESLNVFLKPLFVEEWMLWIDNEAYNGGGTWLAPQLGTAGRYGNIPPRAIV